MAFEDYGSVSKESLDKSKELYEQTVNKEKSPEKQERPERFEPLSDTPVKTKKHGIGSKFAEVFFATSPAAARDHVVTNIFLPTLKDLVLDMAYGYLSMFLYDRPAVGGRRGRSGADVYSQAFSRSSNVSRERLAGSVGNGASKAISATGTRRMEDELIFDDMGEAQEYLDNFREILDRYGVLSIGDVMDMCGLSHTFTDDKYGWKNLSQANVRRLGHGQYTIYFPRALPINK